MKKDPFEKSLFDTDPLDEALDLITAMKSDLKEMKTCFKSRQANLDTVKTLLLEIQDSICNLSQPEIFTETTAGSDDDFGQLEELIGAEAAHKIVDAFAGSTIYIPKNVITGRNHRAIRKEYNDGASYRELGVKYGYTETHIRNIIHREKTGA